MNRIADMNSEIARGSTPLFSHTGGDARGASGRAGRKLAALFGALCLAGNFPATGQIPNSPRNTATVDRSSLGSGTGSGNGQGMKISPNFGTNSPNVNFAPSISAGNASFGGADTSGVSVGGGPAGNASTGQTGNRTESLLADKIENTDFDPQNETFVNKKTGAIWTVTDNRLVDARFERYLNQDAAAEERRRGYMASLDLLLSLLCPQNPYGPSGRGAGPERGNLAKAYDLLRSIPGKHAEFDSGIAEILANQVDMVNAALAERQRLYGQADWLDKEMKRTKWNMDVTVKRRIDDMNGRGSATTPDSLADDSRESAYTAQVAAPYVKDLARQQAMQTAKLAQAEAKLLLAKTEFQTLLMQLFAGRRFQHVLIGGAFYRNSFGDGDGAISAQNKVGEILSDQFGVPLTVGVLEAATAEAIHDVRRGMGSVGNMIKARRLAGAEKRLMEVLVIGENLPEMLSFPVSEREKLLSFRQGRREVAKAIEVKDFARAEEKNGALSEMAADYDAAPARAAVEAAKSESAMHLAKARNAASAGDQGKAEEEAGLAAAAWPQNPALSGGVQSMMDRFNQQSLNLSELDALLQKKDLRGIEEKREIFAACVADDPGRQKLLREAMESLARIEKALERGREFEKAGSPADAWLAVEAAAREFPSDPKLAQAASGYSMRAPKFVSHVSRARDAESGGQTALALVHYLAAYGESPGCEEARGRIANLAETQLASLGGK